MKLLSILFTFIAVLFFTNTLVAQNEVKLRDIECYNLGDGRYYCQDKEKKTPLQGKSRIIDGYTTQYVEVEFKDGIPNGSWKVYKYNVLTEEYLYENGILNGDYKEYYSDGAIKVKRSYSKGKPNGKFIEYGPTGKIEKEKGFKDGLEDGPEIKYDKEGNIRSEEYFVAGKAEGKVMKKISSNTGDYTLSALYKEGAYEGDYSETFTNGTVKIKGKYSKGKKTGTWESAKKSGQKISTDEYVNNEKVKETIYYTDGTVEVVRELKDGKKNGYERKYTYGDGSLKSELYYQDGELASAPSGSNKSSSNANSQPDMVKQTRQISSDQGSFIQSFYQVNGKYEGEFTEQWVEGSKAMKIKGQYTKGLKQGLWVYLDEYGKKEKEENYIDNKLNGKRILYSGGKIHKMKTFKNDEENGDYEIYNVYNKLIEKGTYVNGRVEGKRTYYFSNGKPSSEEILPHDPDEPRSYKESSETGILRQEGTRDGGRELERKEYDENGQLKLFGKDDGNGRFVVVEEYDSAGKKIDKSK